MMVEPTELPKETLRTRKEVGSIIAKKCARAGVSLADLAEYLGVTRTTIYNWIYGKSEPRVSQYTLAMRYLDHKIKELDT